MQVTFKGNPITLEGPNTIQAGQMLPDFTLLDSGLAEMKPAQMQGKVTLMNIVPSLDTPVCQIQSKQFYERLKSMPVQMATISMDLPFAQKRFCGAEGLEMMTLSDHREASFGKAMGLLLPNLRLLTRAVVICDAQGKVSYVEIVPEVTNEPNYDNAMKALEALVAAKV
jgi:thioredoxin-dependent peroxiredoxin